MTYQIVLLETQIPAGHSPVSAPRFASYSGAVWPASREYAPSSILMAISEPPPTRLHQSLPTSRIVPPTFAAGVFMPGASS